MVRTMNHETHEYKEIKYQFHEMDGLLCGEFIKDTDRPDGRCRFISEESKIIVLCYVTNGDMLKGPGSSVTTITN